MPQYLFTTKPNQQAVMGVPVGKLNDLDKRLKAVEGTEASDMQKSVYDPAGGNKQVAFADELNQLEDLAIAYAVAL